MRARSYGFLDRVTIPRQVPHPGNAFTSMHVPAGSYVITAKMNMCAWESMGNMGCELVAGDDIDRVDVSSVYSPLGDEWPGSAIVYYPVALTVAHTFGEGGGDIILRAWNGVVNKYGHTQKEAIFVRNIKITAIRVKDVNAIPLQSLMFQTDSGE